MIKQVASLVGPGHEVDLKNYELLIIVEVYQVSVAEVETCLRFSLLAAAFANVQKACVWYKRCRQRLRKAEAI